MCPEIEFIKSCGFRVFVRPEKNPRLAHIVPTYCFYTDADCSKIAYAQWGSYSQGVHLVHKPNLQVGSGFKFSDTIDKESLISALFSIAPAWATSSDFRSVRKWESFDAYLKASKWNSELVEV